MSITERAKDMGVEELVKEIKNLKKNNDKLNNQLRKVKKEARKLGVENKKLKEGLKIETEFRVYDKLRKKYVEVG